MVKAVLTRFFVSVFVPLLVLCASGRAATEKQENPMPDFEAMLNLNYCYGTDLTDKQIAAGSLLSLLELAEDDNGRCLLPIAQVDRFIQDFYGKTVSYADCGLEVVNGRILIPAMGYDLFQHTLISVKEDGDQIKVVSKVVFEGHDEETFDALCTSVFKINKASVFGCNLISSEILA